MKMSGNTKWEITYEDEDTISVFKYNSDINKNGPVSVEFRYKPGFKHPTDQKKKTLGDLVGETTPKKKSQRPKS